MGWLHVSVIEPRVKAERSHMASFNQPNGTSTSFISRSPNIPHRAQPRPLVPFANSNFPTVPRTSTACDDTYTNSLAQGRSTPAIPTWNAAALLNPRGFQKTQQQDERKAKTPVNNTPSANIAFQFDSPTSSDPPDQHAHLLVPGVSGYGYMWPNNETPGIGMGHMLERMHNVSERDFPLQKRRKIDRDDEDDNTRNANFGGGGQGGVLGEYMKEKQDQGRKEAAANETRPSVDLTGGRLFHLISGPKLKFSEHNS